MKLQTLLEREHIAYEETHHAPTFSSQHLAAAEHVSGYNVAKPVVVKGKSGFTMCVLPGCAQLDLSQVAKVLGDKKVRLATEKEMAELFTDCELGAEPPVGSIYGIDTIMDEQLRQYEFLLMQAGTHTEALKLRREDWERLCKPTVATIARA